MKGKPLTRKVVAEVRAAYSRGEGSIADLSKRFGISRSTLEKRCAKEHWQVRRQQIGEQAEEKARVAEVESIATMLTKHRRIAGRLLALAEKKLDAAEAKAAETGKEVSSQLLDDLGLLLTRATRQERLAAGIEPAKPVMAFETASAGAVLRVKRRRNPEVPDPVAEAAPAKAAP